MKRKIRMLKEDYVKYCFWEGGMRHALKESKKFKNGFIDVGTEAFDLRLHKRPTLKQYNATILRIQAILNWIDGRLNKKAQIHIVEIL